MENKQTLAEYFNTLLDSSKTDKGTLHAYIQSYYTNVFTNLKDGDIKLLEIGVLDGKSMKFWNDWFTSAEIVGMDISEQSRPFIESNGYNVIWGDAYTPQGLSNFDNDYFDFIIDDGPHTLDSQLYSSVNYFPKLKVGGLLIIEDIFDFSYVEQIKDNMEKFISSDSYEFNVYDLRKEKGRFDDVIIEIKRLK